MPTIQYYQNRREYSNEKEAIEKEFEQKLSELNKEYLERIKFAAEKHNISSAEMSFKNLTDLNLHWRVDPK